MSLWKAVCWLTEHDWIYPKGKSYRRCGYCDVIERLPE